MSRSLETILVAYDFSEPATEAARVAFSIAEKKGCGVRAVLVVERRYERRISEHGHLFFDGQKDASKASTVERIKKIVRGRMEAELRSLCPPGVKLDIDVTRGKPFKEILRSAEASGAGMIVIGGTGMSRADQWVIGSTAERLARRSVIPTLIVRRGSTWEPLKILCPLDFSEAAKLAFDEALWLTQLTGASLHVLHVVAGTEAQELQTLGLLNRSDVQRYFRDTQALAEQRLDRFLEGINVEGIVLEQEVVHGRPHEKINLYAQETGIDLIVMGSVGRNEIADLLIGNTTERVLREMVCSVLAVKPEQE